MEYIFKKARAKINLTLNVLEKRNDGYHNIESVFQKISLYDELYIKVVKNKPEGINVTSNILELYSEENIICKAYWALKARYPKLPRISVILRKNIPMQAGLGGGSTDCACFIECINEMFSLNLTTKQMQEIGAKIGADVPSAFCKTPVIARGIGEKIEEIRGSTKFYIVLIKPNFSCNTKEMYEKLDNTKQIEQVYSSNIVKEAILNKDIDKIANNLYNVFENSVTDINIMKEELIAQGAKGSLMTGSGSCIYGIFDEKETAKSAFYTLKNKYETYFSITV